MTRGRVLVVDDKPNFLGLFRRILGDEFEVETANDANEALAILARQPADLVLSDVRMPGPSGHDLLDRVRTLYPDVVVILMTAYGAIADAVNAMRAGAYHYLTKPFDPDDAVALVREVMERREKQKEGNARRPVIAESAAMKQVLALVGQAARSEAAVLITGDSGTGKEIIAREVHALSSRRSGPFIAVNCGAIAEALIESELFGVVKGAYTGATAARGGLFHEAAGGTLFLDEIGELPAVMQVKLLRAIQEKAVRRVGGTDDEKVDVRIIAASNADVKGAVQSGRLRSDLYYRLNVVSIAVPTLRERREDVLPLAKLFLEECAREHGRTMRFSADAEEALLACPWPGNVRQLENAIARACAAAEEALTAAHLPQELAGADGAAPSAVPLADLSYREVLAHSRDRISREYLAHLLRSVHGNVASAAEKAGVERESLYRLLKRYGLRAEDFRSK